MGVTVVTAADRDHRSTTDRADGSTRGIRARGHVPVRGARHHAGAQPAGVQRRRGRRPSATGSCRDQPEHGHGFVGARPAARSRVHGCERPPIRRDASPSDSSCPSASEGNACPMSARILDATIDTTAVSRPLLTRQRPRGHQAARVRPHARGARRQVVLWGAIYSCCIWMVALFWWATRRAAATICCSRRASADGPGLRGAAQPAGSAARHDAVRATRTADVDRAAVLCPCLGDRFRQVARAGLSYLPLAGALALSVVLILFGGGPAGSNAKVNLGPLQPVEFIRLLLALFLAGYFARRWESASTGSRPTRPGVHVPRLAQRAAR